MLPDNWHPKQAADQVLNGLINVCLPKVKGAHDSDFIIVDGKSYVVYMANDVQPGEAPQWPFVYNAMSIVDIATGTVEKVITFAASERQYENDSLPLGACFVPRILRLDADRLRCFFASADPASRQSQTWYIDFDLRRSDFDWRIYPAELETDQGVFPMQPQHFHRHAAAKGFTAPPVTHGLYMIDGFKSFDGQLYAVLNNFPGGQNALSVLNAERTRFTVLGDYFQPLAAECTESAINRLPDGSWCAISRQENRDRNYMFATSRDGRDWSAHVYRELVVDGTSSKPTFDHFGALYYLGWQEQTRINGAFRSVFNIEISGDGVSWQRKYRFESDRSFQYPTFHAYDDEIYLSVTQGDTSESRKERIMFGRLEGK